MGCYNSAVVNATADQVWEAVKNFHDLSWSKNVITKLDVVGDKSGKEIGARRILNDAFHETLLSVDENSRTFTYSIDDGPAVLSKDAISGYIGKVSIFSITENNTAFVLWTSSWETSRNGGVAEFCNPIYQALLKDLKSSFA